MKSPTTAALGGLVGRLFMRPVGSSRPADIIVWWERRRIAYNLIVGLVGAVTSAAMVTVAFTCESRGGAPIRLPDPPALAIVAVLVYGLLANVCYTGGWITELLVIRLWQADTSRFGPIAYALGTAFSALITLTPAVVILAAAALTSCGGPSQ